MTAASQDGSLESAAYGLGPIVDPALRSSVIELFDDARLAARDGRIDVIVLAARRLACVYQLLVEHGYPQIDDCLVVSDRYLDLGPDLTGLRVRILDDSVVLGSTLHKLHTRLTKHVGPTGTVETAAVCVDVSERAPFLLENIGFRALLERPSTSVEDFSTEIVTALFDGGVPFFSDFPTSLATEIDVTEWFSQPTPRAWVTFDVTAPLFGEGPRSAIAQIPRDEFERAVLGRLPSSLSPLVDGFKIRSYLHRPDLDIKTTPPAAATVRVVPIAMLLPCRVDQLDDAWHALVSELGMSDLETVDWTSLTPPAKHRLLQLVTSWLILGATEADYPGGQRGLVLDPLPLRLYLGDHADAFSAALATGVTALLDSPASSASTPDRTQRPQESLLSQHPEMRRLFWELREMLASWGLPEASEHGEISKIGFVFAHAVTSVFGFIGDKFEAVERRSIRELGSLPAYQTEFENGTRRVLEQGLTMGELAAALSPVRAADPGWTRMLLSLGVDMGNDLGVIVPVTRFDPVRELVYRAYRFGETAPLANRPLPRAIRTLDWDRFTEAVLAQRPDHLDTMRDWLAHRHLHAETVEQLRERFVAELTNTFPGDAVQRYTGAVIDVDDETFTADLVSVPEGAPSVTRLRRDVIAAAQQDELEPGSELNWTVYEQASEYGKSRTSTIRIVTSAEFDLAKMDRSAARFAYLVDAE